MAQEEVSAAGCLDRESAKVAELPQTEPEQANGRTRNIWLMLSSSCVFRALGWRET